MGEALMDEPVMDKPAEEASASEEVTGLMVGGGMGHIHGYPPWATPLYPNVSILMIEWLNGRWTY